MSDDLVPQRHGLRASHEDRDQVVERLRVAAGDGRLTLEELDERLEAALAARTHGELEALLLDLPAVPGAAPPATKELVRLEANKSNLRRGADWVVPKRLEVEVRHGNVVLDFTQATITQPALDLAVAVHHGNLTLIVPPEVTVDLDSVAVRSGNAHHRVRHEPGTPVRLLVTVSGTVRSSNLVVRGRRPARRTFWQWLLRRPALAG